MRFESSQLATVTSIAEKSALLERNILSAAHLRLAVPAYYEDVGSGSGEYRVIDVVHMPDRLISTLSRIAFFQVAFRPRLGFLSCPCHGFIEDQVRREELGVSRMFLASLGFEAFVGKKDKSRHYSVLSILGTTCNQYAGLQF